MHNALSFYFDMEIKIPLSLCMCTYNKDYSVLKKQSHISQSDWPIAISYSVFKSSLIMSQLRLCEIRCFTGLKD